jgi:hypothetical protein
MQRPQLLQVQQSQVRSLVSDNVHVNHTETLRPSCGSGELYAWMLAQSHAHSMHGTCLHHVCCTGPTSIWLTKTATGDLLLKRDLVQQSPWPQQPGAPQLLMPNMHPRDLSPAPRPGPLYGPAFAQQAFGYVFKKPLAFCPTNHFASTCWCLFLLGLMSLPHTSFRFTHAECIRAIQPCACQHLCIDANTYPHIWMPRDAPAR